MNDTNKFDKTLDDYLEPFGYVEGKEIIECDRAGTMVLVAYGALNIHGHYSPELGGIAVVHLDPDLFIAVKYIPWSKDERALELKRQAVYFEDNKQHMIPGDILSHLHEKCEYESPAQKKKAKDEYIENIATKNKEQAEAMRKDAKEKEDVQEAASRKGLFTEEGEKLISLDDD